MLIRKTSLSENIIQFCRFLRGNGFIVGAQEETDVLKALQYIDYNSSQVFRLALKAILCRSKQQWELFDGLWKAFWKELIEAVDSKRKDDATPKNQASQEASFKLLKQWLGGNRNVEVEEVASYSTNESVYRKNFADMPADEMDEIMRSIKALSKRMAAKTNRRYERDNQVNLPDLRRTLRKNMRRGGELIEIAFRKPKRNRTKLVIICDVSRSMELYAAFLLQFMYAFQQVYRRCETFAFSTSLQHVTPLLKQKDFHTAMNILSAENSGWNGGTRIGGSLSKFVRDHASKLLDKKTIVLIMSDGWDTGDIGLLEQAMEKIHAMAGKTIWLNPLSGYKDYKPQVAGMKAALPYTDVFAPVHNVESLRKLAYWL